MRISACCTAVLVYAVIGHPPPAVAQVDQQRGQEYFKEAQALADVRAAAADAAIRAASTILSKSVKGEVADDLLAKGITEVRQKLN